MCIFFRKIYPSGERLKARGERGGFWDYFFLGTIYELTLILY